MEIRVPEIKSVDISMLKVDGKNPNKMSKDQMHALKTNIEKYGFLIPIITNKDYLVADGEHRLQIAQELGMKHVPVIALQVDEVNRRMIRQIMNKLKGEHDQVMDEEEYKYIMDQDEFSQFKSLMALSDRDEVRFIAKIKNAEEDEFDTKKSLKAPAYKVKSGDIWVLGNHRLMCGDATKSEDVAILTQDDKPVLMVTDPPYGVSYDPKWRDEADKKTGLLGNNYPTKSMGDVPNDNRVDWSDAYKLFNGDIMYVWHAGRFTGEVQASIQVCEFDIIKQIIWVKPHFILSRGDYHWKHEPCFYAVRKGKKHNWQGDRSQTTVWEIAGMNCFGGSSDEADERTGHGTQKPLKCMATPIENNSSIYDFVYDPFGGSGTTLIACEQLDRKCLMMEIDSTYCSVIIERWEKLTGKKGNKIGG